MNDKPLDLSGLNSIYNEAIDRDEKTIAFDIQNGRGRFLFLMFFDDDDKSTKDDLFIFLRNTRRMIKLKLYGSHSNGKFDVYINRTIQNYLKAELQLGAIDYETPFIFNRFFSDLNTAIPQNLNLNEKIITLRNSWGDIKNELPKDVIDENKKIHLIGIKSLPKNKKPREKTLRKLYLYDTSNSEAISALIDHLKKINHTVAWTDNPDRSKVRAGDLLRNVSTS